MCFLYVSLWGGGVGALKPISRPSGRSESYQMDYVCVLLYLLHTECKNSHFTSKVSLDLLVRRLEL